MRYSGTYWSKYNFYRIFQILLEVHVVKLKITFDNHAESHLNDGKYHIYSVIIETPT